MTSRSTVEKNGIVPLPLFISSSKSRNTALSTDGKQRIFPRQEFDAFLILRLSLTIWGWEWGVLSFGAFPSLYGSHVTREKVFLLPPIFVEFTLLVNVTLIPATLL